jgi:hypothetical protein
MENFDFGAYEPCDECEKLRALLAEAKEVGDGMAMIVGNTTDEEVEALAIKWDAISERIG